MTDMTVKNAFLKTLMQKVLKIGFVVFTYFGFLVCIKFEKTHFHCHICHRFSFPAPKKTAAERGKTESELLIIVN